MLRDNKLRRLNPDPCLPMLSEAAANRSDLPNIIIMYKVANFITFPESLIFIYVMINVAYKWYKPHTHLIFSLS